MKKNLPIGINSFEIIRTSNFIYIDKTEFIYQLTNHVGRYFLSRPRRFGKSLFLDTLKCLFEGKKELFKGLFIYDKWDWNKKFPIIKIDFASGDLHVTHKLIEKIFKILQDNYQYHDIPYSPTTNYNIDFQTLVQKIHKKYQQKVVILIDEYDKPILDCITDIETAKKHRDILRDLYSVIKGSDEILQFAFLTGVSKFSKLSVFSTLNNLTDISLTKDFANICGYTHEDILSQFQDYLQIDVEQMKSWYNGYCWHVNKPKVYNPFDVLLLLQNKEFKNYWFESGTPSFLVNLIQQKNYYLPDIENITVDDNFLNTFDLENLNIISLLWQTGYLTIKQQIIKYNIIRYQLYYPNLEVEYSFNQYLFSYFTKDNPDNTADLGYQTLIALENYDLKKLEQCLYTLFASISYTYSEHLKNFENYYGTVIYSFFKGLGLHSILEDHTNKGRIDLTVVINEGIYLFEFKMKHLNLSALEQIKTKKYYEKYQNQGKPIYLIGVIFDKENKNITTFEWEKL